MPPFEGRARTVRELLPRDVFNRANWVVLYETAKRTKVAQSMRGPLMAIKRKLVEEVKKQAAAVREADVELQRREEVLTLASKAPSVKEMRAATSQLFKEYDLSPIKELIEMSRTRGKDALPARDRMALLKFLAEYEAPRPKSVDIQQDTNMHVSVGMVDFRNVRAQKNVAEVAEEEYEEFVNE